VAGGVRSIEKCSNLIRNRNCHLMICSTVSQTMTLQKDKLLSKPESTVAVKNYESTVITIYQLLNMMVKVKSYHSV
jgi:hypothetical protein